MSKSSSESSAHTAGPWRVVMNGDEPWDGKETQYIGFENKDSESVLNGCGECGSPWCENPADARLIAAAPELLEACVDALAAFDWSDSLKETGITKEERIAQSKSILESAITKARISPKPSM